MSEYGIKIKNISAGSIYECNLGVREQLDTKDAMLTNSLFLDFLLQNGLSVWKETSTRDVISLDFNYGSRSYEEDLKHLESIKAKSDQEDKKRIARMDELIERCHSNKDKYDKKSKRDLRKLFYTNGTDVTYHTYNKNGKIIKSETIHYKMLYRTPGKAKKGSVVFICDRLYQKARDFLYMGIRLPDDDAQIVEIGAYSSLITSSIVGRVKIKPENILILKDVESFFRTNVVSVELNNNNECVARELNDYEVKNTLFDGQALIDTSIFPAWGDGYILLRHHMTKCAAFKTHIQKFFKEKFGGTYETATVEDMWGNKHLAKDIKMITTDNAIKWLKFDVSYNTWCQWVHKNGCLFGIVKTAHKSKLNDVQKMSYQMVNALDINTIDDAMTTTKGYLTRLQTDDDEFLKYLEKNINFSNDFEVLIALVKQNPDFIRSEYFRERKKKIINTYVLNMKTGKLIQNADNLVIVGNPYGMLLYSIGEDPLEDPTFTKEGGCIQCWTSRFGDNEYLAEFRNPFNSRNNLGYLHNYYHRFFDRYFDLGEQIIAVNMIGTDFQDRNNGSDMDSDSIYVTNEPNIVAHAKRCYAEYPTIVNNIPKEKNHYANTLENYASIDHNLAKSQLAIGESSNLAQICLSYTYNFDDRKFDDYTCILSVLAQAAIDNAKRTFACDISSEIRRIKNEMDIVTNRYPAFWSIIRPEFKRYKITKDGTKVNMINKDINCPMNVLYRFKPQKHKSTSRTLPMSHFFIQHDFKGGRRKCKKVEELIQKYAFDLYRYNTCEDTDTDDHLLMMQNFEELIEDIKKIHISNNYLPLMSYLINRAFLITPQMKGKRGVTHTSLNKNKALLLKTLYRISPQQLLQVFAGNSANQNIVNQRKSLINKVK